MADEAAKEPLTRDQALASITNDLPRLAFLDAEKLTNEYNQYMSRIEAAAGDPQALLENLRETSENPKVVSLRDKIEAGKLAVFKLEEQRDAILKDEVAAIRADAEKSVEADKVKADEAAKKIAAYMPLLRNMVSAEVLAFLPTKVGKKRGGGGGGGNAGTPRVRGYNVLIGEQKFTNVSAAAKHLEVDSSVLTEAFYAKVGDERPANITVPVTVKGESVNLVFQKHEQEVKVAAEAPATPAPAAE